MFAADISFLEWLLFGMPVEWALPMFVLAGLALLWGLAGHAAESMHKRMNDRPKEERWPTTRP